MSVTRIICEKCGYPLAWCECGNLYTYQEQIDKEMTPKQVFNEAKVSYDQYISTWGYEPTRCVMTEETCKAMERYTASGRLLGCEIEITKAEGIAFGAILFP